MDSKPLRFHKSEFLVREKAPQSYLIVSLAVDAKEVYQVTGLSTLFLKESLKESPDYNAVSEYILKNYKVTPERLDEDCRSFFAAMKSAGIFVE